jgi:hypothetical protein
MSMPARLINTVKYRSRNNRSISTFYKPHIVVYIGDSNATEDAEMCIHAESPGKRQLHRVFTTSSHVRYDS